MFFFAFHDVEVEYFIRADKTMMLNISMMLKLIKRCSLSLSLSALAGRERLIFQIVQSNI